MNAKQGLWVLGAVALLGACDRTGLDPVGVYPEPELAPGPTTSPLAGNEPGLDTLVDPGMDPVEPVF
jgi:hypothetical protein